MRGTGGRYCRGVRRLAVVAVLAFTALGAAPSVASMKVRNRLTITQPDGTRVGFGPEIRVWCGPFEPGVPVRSIHVRVGGPPKLERPRWELSAVVKDVRRRPKVRWPHSFNFDEPTGALLFAYDGHNEVSTAEEEGSGTIRFGRVRCGRRMRVSFRIQGRLGSEFSDFPALTVNGSFTASVN